MTKDQRHLMTKDQRPLHPGVFIHETVLKPQKINVTSAAKLLGISRPAFSNFLHGKVATSPEMATRIETAFGFPASELLRMQEVYQSSTQESAKVTENTQRYVPAFLEIKARDIMNWADSNLARQELPVLLRFLVHSTGRQLLKVDFPGNDNAQQPGADGLVEAGEGSPWVPKGSSWWEMGTNKTPRTKAKSDFEKRTNELTEHEQSELTYVFVTPRSWANKKNQIEEWKNNPKCKWKDIRIYDVSDLEQWIEQSIPAQVWCSTRMSKVKFKVRTLEQCCREWCKSGFTDDRSTLTDDIWKELFKESVERWGERVKNYLTSDETRPFIIEAHSHTEALTFLYYVMDSQEGHYYQDRVIFFNEVGILPTLLQGPVDFIPVIAKREVEKEVEGCPGRKVILIYPPHVISKNVDVSLGVVSVRHFERALWEEGKNDQNMRKLKKESGRSLTVLRRILLTSHDICKPDWVEDAYKRSIVLPLAFLGNIDINNPQDKELFTKLFSQDSTQSVDKVFEHLGEFAREEDTPVWRSEDCYGVYSKIDVLLYIATRIQRQDVERFFEVARIVLGEDNPALDLSIEQPWFNSTRRHYTDEQRRSLAETLVLLSVYSRSLFEPRRSCTVRQQVYETIRDILSPFTTRTLQAHNSEFSLYAEAAPEVVLSLVEDDLDKGGIALNGIMKPVPSSLIVDCSRNGFVTAMEVLAWKSDYFPRVVRILGALSVDPINDQYGAIPYNSLANLLSPFIPQTLAPLTDRLYMVDFVFEQYPAIGRKLALDMVACKYHYATSGNHWPEWMDCGGKISWDSTPKEDTIAMLDKLECELINGQTNKLDELQELIGIAMYMSSENQDKVISLIENFFLHDETDEESQATLYETIQFKFFSKWAKQMFQNLQLEDCREKWRTLSKHLESKDPVFRWSWLFDRGWMDDDRLGLPENYTLDQLDKCVNKLGIQAITEILEVKDLAGIWQLCARGVEQYRIGWILSSQVLTKPRIVRLVDEYLKLDSPKNTEQDFMQGLLAGIPDADKPKFYSQLLSQYRDKAVSLLLRAPFQLVTWQEVSKLPESEQQQYWSQVTARYVRPEDPGKEECIRHLLAVQRPRAAFQSMILSLDVLDHELLLELLKRIAEVSDEPINIESFDYDIRKALAIINKHSNKIYQENLAYLEFIYLRLLVDWGKPNVAESIPNLANYIENQPEFYASLVKAVYQDTGSSGDKENGVNKAWQERASLLLQVFDQIPGLKRPTEEEQKNTLYQWVTTVRTICQQVNLDYEADYSLGKLLSHAFIGTEEVCPPKAVCEVLQKLPPNKIDRGIVIGVRNARGPHFVSDTGVQERELAHRYQRAYESLRLSNHRVASSILHTISNLYEKEGYDVDNLGKVRKHLAR